MQMTTLGTIIAKLKQADQQRIVPFGFGQPMSYRGYYDQLAFEPKRNVTIASMLSHAESALGQIFTGYKGGEYLMDANTECWIAEYGTSDGDCIGPTLLAYICGDTDGHA